MRQTIQEVRQMLYGTTDEKLAENRANRRGRRVARANRRLKNIFRKPKGLANRG